MRSNAGDESTIDLSKFGSYLQEAYKQEEWAFVSDVVRLVCISDRRRHLYGYRCRSGENH